MSCLCLLIHSGAWAGVSIMHLYTGGTLHRKQGDKKESVGLTQKVNEFHAVCGEMILTDWAVCHKEAIFCEHQ